jgi:hypothetical protein
MIGATQENVNKGLRRLYEQRLIEISDRKMTILDLEGLRE